MLIMSEQSPEYDPMSVREDIDEIYGTVDMVQHNLHLRRISREASLFRRRAGIRTRQMTTIRIPELFGDYGSEDPVTPPIAPD